MRTPATPERCHEREVAIKALSNEKSRRVVYLLPAEVILPGANLKSHFTIPRSICVYPTIEKSVLVSTTLSGWRMNLNFCWFTAMGASRAAPLVALTLMIAVSHTKEMDTMVKVVVSLINRKN